MTARRARRPERQFTLTTDAHETLSRVGGERNKSAVLEALLAALSAGEVPTFEARFRVALDERRDQAAERARAATRTRRRRGSTIDRDTLARAASALAECPNGIDPEDWDDARLFAVRAGLPSEGPDAVEMLVDVLDALEAAGYARRVGGVLLAARPVAS